MENLFLNKEKYIEYTKKKKNAIKKRELIKTESINGGEDAYLKDMYDINEFEEMPKEYGVTLEYYKDKEKNSWDIIKVIIKQNDEIIFEFVRDYSSISMCYAKNDNMDYIIFTGEHYQGFSIYNLTKRTFFSFIPPFGWCPIEIRSYDEDSKELSTYGCVWGGDMEYRYYKIPNLDAPTFNDYEYTIDN